MRGRYGARSGQRFAARDFVLLVAPPRRDQRRARRGCEGSASLRRLGVTVSRRVGGAVVRNRVKRAVRVWFRWSRHGVDGDLDLVVIARRGAAGLRAAEVAEQLDRLLARRGRDAVR